jgi:hypothetical protein
MIPDNAPISIIFHFVIERIIIPIGNSLDTIIPIILILVGLWIIKIIFFDKKG